MTKKELEARNKRLVKMVNEERERVAGYEQIAKLHSAYIAILLNELGATKDNGFIIKPGTVSDALKCEVRAIPKNNGDWELYCESK